MKTPQQRLLETLRELTPTERQNRLMRIGDREIAMAVTHMSEADRTFVLTHIAPQKTARVRDELRLQARMAIRPRDYLAAVAHVRSCLISTATRAVLGSYIRPRGGRR